jgi:hypothetical protein
MKNTAAYFAIICAMLFLAACKPEDVAPNNALIAGKYTVTKKEVSSDNVTWYDNTTHISSREVLTLKSDKTYDSSWLNTITGDITPNMTGKWSLSNNGNTLMLKANGFSETQDITILSLTSTAMTISHLGFYVNNHYSSSYSNYTRYTYTRQ